jgi:hypothetical protein
MHEFPDDASPEEIDAATREFDAPSANDSDFARLITGAPKPQAAANPADDMSTLDKVRAGFGSAIVGTGRGVKQAVTDNARRFTSTMAPLVDAYGMDAAKRIMHGADDYVAASQASQQADIDETRRLEAPLMDTKAGLAGNVLGQVAQTAAIPGGAASTLGKFGLSAANGALFSGLQPVASGEYRALNTGLGAGLGVVGQGVASGLGRLATGAKNALPEAVQTSIDLARRAGIPLNVAQVSESGPIKAMQAVSRWLPFSGAAGAAKGQQEAFNSALGRSMGLDKAKYLTDDVMRSARQKIGGVFEDIYGRNDVPLSADAMRRLVAVESGAAKNLTHDEAQVVRNQLDRIISNSEDGALTGKKYQAVRTLIQKAEGPDKTGSAVKELRKTLDDIAAEAIGPDDAAALAKSRGQWANMRVVEDALKQASGAAGQGGGAAGNVRPASLWPLIRKGSTKEMRELAKIGQNVLKDGLGDSGSAQRQFYTNLMTGGGGAIGAASLGVLPLLAKGIAGGAVAGRALNSNMASKLLQQGKPTAGLARLVSGAPRALPVAGPRLGQMLELEMAGGRVATPEEVAADDELVRRFKQKKR